MANFECFINSVVDSLVSLNDFVANLTKMQKKWPLFCSQGLWLPDRFHPEKAIPTYDCIKKIYTIN